MSKGAEPGFTIELEDLHKSYTKGGRTIDVLRGVDLRLAPGEMVSIMGRSGAGKSTLLHLLGGLERASRGSLRIGGREVSEMDDRELTGLRSQHVGLVFQFHHLLPEFTALENVFMPDIIAGATFEDARRRATEALAEVELTHRLEHRPGELSGGEQQRVALARALVRRPGLLLADEPTGNLDHRTGGAVFRLLVNAVRQRGAILVMVTHDRELAETLPRTMHLEDGILVERDAV